MTEDALLVLCSCPDEETALRIANTLIERSLAACVNISQPVTSVYRWQGKIETTAERLLLIKTVARRYASLEACIEQQHPYELPEVIAVPIDRGLSAYLGWVRQCTKSD